MAPTIIRKWILLIIITTVLLKLIELAQARRRQRQVPCMFLFGDSQFDNGNNNVLITPIRSNYQPYGIDYPDGPTGRFSNGRNIPDFLAEFLGLPSPISPFVQTGIFNDLLGGVNYASGAAGILDSSGSRVGDRVSMSVSMNRQLLNHKIIIELISFMLEESNEANDYLNKCLYVVNIGTSDYLYSDQLTFNNQLLAGPEELAELLIVEYNQQLRALYNDGARKVAVYGIGPIDSSPQQVLKSTNYVQTFNDLLLELIESLNTELPGARFTFINMTNILLGDPSLAGIRVTNVSCCPMVNETGLCVRNSVPCLNRDEYRYWDGLHTTEIVNRDIAARSYTAKSPADATPVDIKRLVQQSI